MLLWGEWVDIDCFYFHWFFFEVGRSVKQLCALTYISSIFPGHGSVALRKKVLDLATSRGKFPLRECGLSMARLLSVCLNNIFHPSSHLYPFGNELRKVWIGFAGNAEWLARFLTGQIQGSTACQVDAILHVFPTDKSQSSSPFLWNDYFHHGFAWINDRFLFWVWFVLLTIVIILCALFIFKCKMKFSNEIQFKLNEPMKRREVQPSICVTIKLESFPLRQQREVGVFLPLNSFLHLQQRSPGAARYAPSRCLTSANINVHIRSTVLCLL